MPATSSRSCTTAYGRCPCAGPRAPPASSARRPAPPARAPPSPRSAGSPRSSAAPRSRGRAPSRRRGAPRRRRGTAPRQRQVQVVVALALAVADREKATTCRSSRRRRSARWSRRSRAARPRARRFRRERVAGERARGDEREGRPGAAQLLLLPTRSRAVRVQAARRRARRRPRDPRRARRRPGPVASAAAKDELRAGAAPGAAGPTAFCGLSERSELEHTSSARPSSTCAGERVRASSRRGRRPRPRRASCQAPRCRRARPHHRHALTSHVHPSSRRMAARPPVRRLPISRFPDDLAASSNGAQVSTRARPRPGGRRRGGARPAGPGALPIYPPDERNATCADINPGTLRSEAAAPPARDLRDLSVAPGPSSRRSAAAERDPEFEEGAQTEHEAFTLARLGENQRRELQQIDAAIARVDAGEYGICRDCDEGIDPRRLAALPYALLCTECATRVERAAAPTFVSQEPPTL